MGLMASSLALSILFLLHVRKDNGQSSRVSSLFSVSSKYCRCYIYIYIYIYIERERERERERGGGITI